MTKTTDVLWYEDCVVCSESVPITVQAFSVEPVCPVCGAVYDMLHLDFVREGDNDC